MCPNKNSKEYKMLVEQLGSDEAALFTWKTMGNRFPPLLQSSADLKKEVGAKDVMSEASLTLLSSNMRSYRYKHNVSHTYQTRKREDGKYDVSLMLNYLDSSSTKVMKNLLNENNIPNNIQIVSDAPKTARSFPKKTVKKDTLLQKGPEGNPLGAFDSVNKIIFGLTNPNITTLPHELGHAFFDRLSISNLEDDKADVINVINWINEQRGISYSTDWNSLDQDTKIAIHEDFANGFLVYLNEGRKTSNKEMNNVFKNFAKWLVDLIDDIKKILGIELNDTVRDIYDRILGLEVASETVEEAEVAPTAPVIEEAPVETKTPVTQAPENTTYFIEELDDGTYAVSTNWGDLEGLFQTVQEAEAHKKDLEKAPKKVDEKVEEEVEDLEEPSMNDIIEDLTTPTEKPKPVAKPKPVTKPKQSKPKASKIKAEEDPEIVPQGISKDDVSVPKKFNAKAGGYPVTIVKTKQVIGLLNKDEETGLWYEMEDDNYFYSSRDEAIISVINDYREDNGFKALANEVYTTINVKDKNGKKISVTVIRVNTEEETVRVKDTTRSGEEEVVFKMETRTVYIYRDIHGITYYSRSKGTEATTTDYNNQEKIETPEPNYKKGDVVTYTINGKTLTDIIRDVTFTRSRETGDFEASYILLKDETPLLEQYIDVTEPIEAKDDFIANDTEQLAYRNVMENIAAKFNTLLGTAINIRFAPLGGNVAAMYDRGSIVVDIEYVISQQGTLNIAELITHEFMHPFVKAMYLTNNELYKNTIDNLAKHPTIYESLKKELDLTNEESAYFGAEEQDIEEEILTRYLGRVISQSFDSETGNIKAEYVTGIIDKESNYFRQLMDWLRSIVDLITGKKSYKKLKPFIKDVNSNSDVNNQTIKEVLTNLYKEAPAIKTYIGESGSYIYENIAKNYNSNKNRKKKGHVDGYRDAVNNIIRDVYKEEAEGIIQDLTKLLSNYGNSVSKFQIQEGANMNGETVIFFQDGDNFIITVDPSLHNAGSSYLSVLKEHAKRFHEDKGITTKDYNELIKKLDSSFYTKPNKKNTVDKAIGINEINPMLELNGLSSFISFQLGREDIVYEQSVLEAKAEKGTITPEEKETLNKYQEATLNIPEISFKMNDLMNQSGMRELKAYMAMSAAHMSTTRSIIVDKAKQLSKVAKNYKSEALRIEATRLLFLDKKVSSEAEFIKEYADEAATAIGIASRKFFEIVADVKSKTGKVGRAELNRLNKEFIIVRQMLSLHSQFESVVASQYADPKEYPRYYKATLNMARVKDSMENATIDLAVEWLNPYAEQHNTYMIKAGFTDAKYHITPRILRDHFRYGLDEDTGFISYWLGSNVTSRNAINALVANTINRDLMITNIDVQDASMDINVAFRDFLKSKGFSNVTSKDSVKYYKEHYLRKASIKGRVWDETLKDYKDAYVDKWAMHQEFLYDQFEKELDAYKESLPEPRDRKQEEQNQDAVIRWKVSRGFKHDLKTGKVTLGSAYINKAYAGLQSDPFFKQLEDKYNMGNAKYGENKLRFGIVPQKYNDNFITQLRDSIKDLKDEKEISSKAKLLKDKLSDHFQSRGDEEQSSNLDGSQMRNLVNTLSTLKDEAHMDLTLHETITDFVGEGSRYGALKETQYNAENLMLLLEGNTEYDISARKLTQPKVSMIIADKNRYTTAKKDLARLEKAKKEGASVDEDKITSLKAIVAKGLSEKTISASVSLAIEELSIIESEEKKGITPDAKRVKELKDIIDKKSTIAYIRDKVTGETVTPKDPKANKMLIAQINQIYFGEGTDDWNIKVLDNMSAKKLAHYVSMYESIVRMGGNVIAASNNVAMGNLHMFIEGHAGRYYNKKALVKATTKYMSNVHNYILDVKNPIKSKEAQLAIQWDAIQGEIQDEFGKKVTGSLASKFFRSGSFFFLTSAGEHQIQITNMLAMAMHKKVTTNAGEEISLYDAYKADTNGRFKLRSDLKDFTQEDLLKFMRDLQGVNRQLNGNYSEFNKTMLQRKWFGNLLLKFRKWMYPSMRAKWGSERVDYERNIVEVGAYNYFFNTYLKDGIKAMLKGQNGFAKKKDMAPHEIYAMRKATMELGVYMGISLLALMMFGGGGDDPKDLNAFEKYALLTMVRLHADLEIYHGGLPNLVLAAIPGVPMDMPNPLKEPIKILRTPGASINTLIQFIKVVEAAGEPSAVYEKSGPGYRKGENKLWINSRKLIPFKQFLDFNEGRFEGTVDGQLGYYEMINKGIKGITPGRTTM